MSAEWVMILLPIAVLAVGLAAAGMAYVSSVRTPVEKSKPKSGEGGVVVLKAQRVVIQENEYDAEARLLEEIGRPT